ncbi:MAG: AMP-binding protein, partial [Proteobacteria bacterium]|nr:AMP-binding protein [Pseudomonadota bacterium]
MKLYDTLTDLVAEARGRERHIRFIDGEHDESVVPFADLWDRARTLLGSLQSRGMQPGDELVIFSQSNENFVIAFWAAILGGIVPVPVAVGISDEHRSKLFRILRQLKRGTLFTDSSLLERLVDFARERHLKDVLVLLESRTILMGDVGAGDSGQVFDASPEDPAFIQYSSGSTSDPKGVCLTHRNLCTNIRAIIEATQWMQDDQSLSWMPLTHDMGLIGYHLSVMAAGMNHAVMDTSVFVRRPLLWMSKANELRATQLCSPNFGYKHFLKLFDRKGLADLDLSCVKLILNGAEPISYDLCEDFLSALAPHGLKRSAMYPVYGLAEATVGVSLGTPGDEYSRITVNRHSLRIGEAFEVAQPGDPDAVSFIKVGNAIRDCEIRLVDNDDVILDDGRVGNIQLHGASVTAKIYGDSQATRELFTGDGWLRTGDCGVFVDKQLVITGRLKDIIIVNGQNYYPHDIEEIAAQIDGLDLGRVVVA